MNKFKSAFICSLGLIVNVWCCAQESLVPDTPSNSPDYFCTWNIQGYVVNFSGADNTRSTINEKYIFGNGEKEGWINYFPKIRSDLYFVMDDSWDIPQDENSSNNNKYLGLVELDESRFPSFKGTPREKLKKLNDAIKSHGWKGAGGWICAQESPIDANHTNEAAYWTERVKAAQYAGFNYWKVDWGKNDRNGQWRKMLSDLGRQYAPDLFIEHALERQFITFSDVYRTYDVESITSAPVTITRIADLLHSKTDGKAKGIINCEDEPYIAIGLGCAIGIMRYPFDGKLLDGRQDMVFPPVGRQLKKRMDEITRAVRWHRIAEPFGVGGAAYVDSIKLCDTWIMGELESWVSRRVGEELVEHAPARVSRGIPLPLISNLHTENQPFVLASKYPNGAVAVATIGRSKGREYNLSCEKVSLELTDLNAPVGIFGNYSELILSYPEKINKTKLKIYAQDLAADKPVDITQNVKIKGNKLIISGDIIRKVGLMAATAGDISDPGMVIKIVNNQTKK